MGCGVGRRLGSDPELLWLWRRPAATALSGPLAREPQCAADATQKTKKQKKKKESSYQTLYLKLDQIVKFK